MFSKLTNLLVSATALLLFVQVVYSYNKYCEMESCSNPKRHVLCLFPNETIGPGCYVRISSGLQENEKKLLLRLHVQFREEHASSMKNKTKSINYPELLWDHDLAMMAQRWAQQCSEEHDECRSLDDYGYVVKQNVGQYVVEKRLLFDYSIAVKDWALTPLNPANPAVGKYQAVDRIGCGLFIRSECGWRTSFPTGGLLCHAIYHFHIVCNYSISKMRLRV